MIINIRGSKVIHNNNIKGSHSSGRTSSIKGSHSSGRTSSIKGSHSSGRTSNTKDNHSNGSSHHSSSGLRLRRLHQVVLLQV